jgi:hypothetical protein
MSRARGGAARQYRESLTREAHVPGSGPLTEHLRIARAAHLWERETGTAAPTAWSADDIIRALVNRRFAAGDARPKE